MPRNFSFEHTKSKLHLIIVKQFFTSRFWHSASASDLNEGQIEFCTNTKKNPTSDQTSVTLGRNVFEPIYNSDSNNIQ